MSGAGHLASSRPLPFWIYDIGNKNGASLMKGAYLNERHYFCDNTPACFQFALRTCNVLVEATMADDIVEHLAAVYVFKHQ
jgi:hypothetical protein